ncbi:unnamed protein product [Plutella xylostella]|uniref:(diamondback moth) hypothetical protein n=1 Tax=Plutella xylostella TaxID=51655 RepID=A0A8S4EZG1_PLUXY|nr:unnamed protein product [Plutella xylostella]
MFSFTPGLLSQQQRKFSHIYECLRTINIRCEHVNVECKQWQNRQNSCRYTHRHPAHIARRVAGSAAILIVTTGYWRCTVAPLPGNCRVIASEVTSQMEQFDAGPPDTTCLMVLVTAAEPPQPAGAALADAPPTKLPSSPQTDHRPQPLVASDRDFLYIFMLWLVTANGYT